MRRIVWDKDTEWWPLLSEALPHAERTGQPLGQCIERVMQHQIPTERHRSLRDIHSSLNNAVIQGYIKEFKRQLRKQASTPPAPVAPPPEPPQEPTALSDALSLADVQRMRRGYQGRVQWTAKEWALLARDYDARKEDGKGHDSFLALLDAQDAVLDLERRRAVGALRREWQKGRIQQNLEDGRANIWTLPEKVSTTLEQALQEPPVQVPEEKQEEPTPAPTPAPIEPTVPAPASDSFAAQVSRVLAVAVDEILRLHHQRVMQVFDERLQVFVQGVRSEVHATLEAELGGPIQSPSVPTPEPDPEPSPPPFQAPPADLVLRPLAVDVVGFSGAPLEAVRRGINGDVDVRFISPEHAKSGGQHFRPNVIAATQFISRSAEARMKKEAKRFIAINGNASQAIAAIKQLQAEQSQPIH